MSYRSKATAHADTATGYFWKYFSSVKSFITYIAFYNQYMVLFYMINILYTRSFYSATFFTQDWFLRFKWAVTSGPFLLTMIFYHMSTSQFIYRSPHYEALPLIGNNWK